jgi:hypothetical protein
MKVCGVNILLLMIVVALCSVKRMQDLPVAANVHMDRREVQIGTTIA